MKCCVNFGPIGTKLSKNKHVNSLIVIITVQNSEKIESRKKRNIKENRRDLFLTTLFFFFIRVGYLYEYIDVRLHKVYKQNI